MRNRPELRLLPLALLVTLSIGCRTRPEPPASRPTLAGAASGRNVLLLSIDTLRADRLNAYGYQMRETSPRMDAFLASGIQFDQASAARALTWPSLASVLTGLYPSGHGVTQNGYELPDDLPTLPKLLGGAGYATGAFLSNMCRANHQGWDELRCSQGRDTRASQWALEWVSQQEESRPFFLWIHLFGAHPPYYNGGELAAKELDPGYQGALAPKKRVLDAVMEEGQVLSEADRRHLDAIYDAAVIGTDRIVGSFLDALEQAGVLENTVVVLLADHGEDLYDHHGYIYHACSVYQSSLHVPLSFSAPGILPQGQRVRQTVELIDVLPTILDLVGLEPPQGLHGASLRPYLERPEAGGAGKPAFTEYGDSRIHTAMSEGWKLIHNPDAELPVCFAGGPEDLYPIEVTELYDLGRDPLEQENLATAEPTRVSRMRELLRERFADLESRGRAQEIPEDLKEELRSLGYIAK
ncbi:MAG: sulfatase [Acidobacteria bacterium]|nr:sulfatase [Acidobacteriota bacterium]